METSFQLYIVAPSPEVRRLWEPALAAEGWKHTFLNDLGRLVETGLSRHSLALVEIEALERASPETGERFRKTGLRYILFGDLLHRSEGELIRLLESGADDVIPATTEGRLLAAKLRAHLRLLVPSLAHGMGVLWSPKRYVKADPRQRLAWSRGGDGRWKAVPGLTETEFALLCLFLRNPESALDRPFILEVVWREQAAAVNAENVDKHVHSLRRKLGSNGVMLKTLYGIGYALREE